MRVRSHARRAAPLLIAALTALNAAPAMAQDSREAEIVRKQEEKARQLHTYKPNKVEDILQQFQDALVLAPNGIYPVFGSVYSGGGFTLGAGYRRYLGDRLNWNLTGLYSAKGYKLFELSLHSPRPLTGHVDFRAAAGWRDATQVAFYGLGIASPDAETTYRMQQGYVGGEVWARPRSWSVLRGALAYESFTMSDGYGGVPDTDDVFTKKTAPGLGDNPDYVHATLAGGIDTRLSPEYARRGSFVEVALQDYVDTRQIYSFRRVDIETVQHVPFMRENWVLSLRGRMQSTVGDTDTVPYFLLPSLGSGSTLRGFHSWRFRDRQSLLMQAEWRWFPNRMALDAALFFDAGTVADRPDALRLADMKTDIGFGIRFHSPVATPLRVEVAAGREGLKLVFGASAAF